MNYANIYIDGEAVRIGLPCSVYSLLRVADVEPEDYYIQRVMNGKPGYAYRNKAELLSIRDGDHFVTVYTGATTNG